MKIDKRLLALALGTFAIGTDNYVIAGILPQMGKSLGVGVTVAAQLITVYALSYALFSPVMAVFISHRPRKTMLAVGLVIFALANVLTTTLPGFGLVVLSRIVAGLGAAMVTPLAGATAATMVPPERRGRALAIVIGGLTAATALGAPLGTAISSLGSWKLALLFASSIAILSVIGIVLWLPHIPVTAKARLRDRLSPVKDRRVFLTLATSLLYFTALFMVYNYVSLVFLQTTKGSTTMLASLILIWGLSALVGNFLAGRLTDRIGNAKVLSIAVFFTIIDFSLLSWSSQSLATATISLVVWGVCGWGALVAQQHRLVSILPAQSSVLLGLNTSTVFIGVSISAIFGAAVLQIIPAPQYLGLVAVPLIILALVLVETARRTISRHASIQDKASESPDPGTRSANYSDKLPAVPGDS